jgi:hypothetical protein
VRLRSPFAHGVVEPLLGKLILRIKRQRGAEFRHSFNGVTAVEAGITTLQMLQNQLLASYFSRRKVVDVAG